MEAFVYMHAIFIRFVDDDDTGDEHSGEHFLPVIFLYSLPKPLRSRLA